MLSATVGEQTFPMPVTFAVGAPYDLIGRTGILERFTVAIDPTMHMTLTPWDGPTVWTSAFEERWREVLAQRQARDRSKPLFTKESIEQNRAELIEDK